MAASNISARRSSFDDTWRYSDIVVNPRRSATLAIDTAAMPSASASSIAAATMPAALIAGRGPRVGAAWTPQPTARTCGSGGPEASSSTILIGSIELCAYVHIVYDIHR